MIGTDIRNHKLIAEKIAKTAVKNRLLIDRGRKSINQPYKIKNFLYAQVILIAKTGNGCILRNDFSRISRIGQASDKLSLYIFDHFMLILDHRGLLVPFQLDDRKKRKQKRNQADRQIRSQETTVYFHAAQPLSPIFIKYLLQMYKMSL